LFFFLKKIGSTKTRIDTHKKHINTLDKLVNMLQDNQISYKKVLDIRESIEDYVERNNEPDFEEISDLFDELELDKIAASMIILIFKMNRLIFILKMKTIMDRI
jgi:CCR4-NOT transcriptional regulation complex NOT5 subunit